MVQSDLVISEFGRHRLAGLDFSVFPQRTGSSSGLLAQLYAGKWKTASMQGPPSRNRRRIEIEK
jgi:hypothetical protein